MGFNISSLALMMVFKCQKTWWSYCITFNSLFFAAV